MGFFFFFFFPADNFNKAWADGWFVELKVEEGGHHIWLAHALLDIFQPSLKAKVLASSAKRRCASWVNFQRQDQGLHADRHFLKAVSEAEIVTPGILPDFRSRPEKGEMLSSETVDLLHVEATGGTVS